MTSIRHIVFALAISLALGWAAIAATTSLTGIVTDSMCGLHHMMKGNPAQCTRRCVQSGSSYALAVRGRVIRLKPVNATAKAALSRLAARRVTVLGHFSGKTFQVNRVAPASH